MDKPIDPLSDFTFAACFMRFLVAAFAGAMLDVAIVFAWLALHAPEWISARTFAWILGLIPPAWGALSVFWLEPMIDFVKAIREQWLGGFFLENPRSLTRGAPLCEDLRMEIRVIRAQKIYSDGKHNAFTGIASLRGRVFVSFRSGASHVSYDGVVKVLASDDLETWREVAALSLPGTDCRDPKVAAFNDSLLVFFGGRTKDGAVQSWMAASKDGENFDAAAALDGVPPGRWLWAVKPFGDTLYGSAYHRREGRFEAALYRSQDAARWEPVLDFPSPGSEASIDFDSDGTLWALVRDDDFGGAPMLCAADPPYSSWRLAARLPLRLQGPLLKRLPGGCALIGRRWDAPGRRNLRTDLFWLPDGGDPQFVRTLPSGGDTSYAGWLELDDGRALVSYYSSHEHKMDEPHVRDAAFQQDPAHAEHSTPADIFLARISYA